MQKVSQNTEHPKALLTNFLCCLKKLHRGLPVWRQSNPAEPVWQFMVHNHEFSSLVVVVCSGEGDEDSPRGMTETKL